MNRQIWANDLKSSQPLSALIAKAANGVEKLLPELHVGKGQRFGNLTWFPIWTDAPVAARNYSTVLDKSLLVGELSNAAVAGLKLENTAEVDVLLFEGTMLEGGMQHRALTRSVLVPAKSSIQLPVVCVEHGRWGGSNIQAFGNKVAPARVRAAMRGMQKGDRGIIQSSADQSKVWSEVAEYAATLNLGNSSESLVKLRNDLDAKMRTQHLPKALLGQRGVVIGIAGKPVALELFDHPETLAERFEALLLGFQPDAMKLPFKETPGYRVRDFIAEISKTAMRDTQLENQIRNEPSEFVASEALKVEGKILHLSALNPKHELVLA